MLSCVNSKSFSQEKTPIFQQVLFMCIQHFMYCVVDIKIQKNALQTKYVECTFVGMKIRGQGLPQKATNIGPPQALTITRYLSRNIDVSDLWDFGLIHLAESPSACLNGSTVAVKDQFFVSCEAENIFKRVSRF